MYIWMPMEERVSSKKSAKDFWHQLGRDKIFCSDKFAFGKMSIFVISKMTKKLFCLKREMTKNRRTERRRFF